MESTESNDHDNEGDKENQENIDESQMFERDEGDDGEYLPEQMQDGYVTIIKMVIVISFRLLNCKF